MRKYEGEPDYAAGDYDDTGRQFTQWRFFHTAVGWLIIANVAIYLVEIVAGAISASTLGAILNALCLFPSQVFAHGHVWQLLTYAFLHDPSNVLHPLLNVLFLYWFGREIEQVWGPRRFLAFYLAAAVFAALTFAGVHYFVRHLLSPCLGASGAVMALVMVYGLWWPNRTILFMFLFPMRVWTFVVIVIVIEIVSLVQAGDNGVANLAHLGGLLFGYLVVRLAPRFAHRVERFAVLRDASKASDGRRLDELLDKVHQQGIQSLSWREQRFLKKMSQRH